MLINKLKIWFLKNRWVIFGVLIILCVALIPRINGIGLFITADEKNWVGRSYEFIKAWRHLRINDTLQTTHPGITVMWVVGLATYAAQYFYHSLFNFDDIRRFATFAQFPMAIINSFWVAAVYLILRKIIRERVAFVAALAIALDPFLIGFAKVVHVDSFLTGFLVISVLLLLYFDKTGSKKAFYLSILFSSLAILTKLPAIAIFPFIFILLAFKRNIFKKYVILRQTKILVIWIISVVVVTVLLWPSLWFVPHPKDNIGQVGKDMTVATLQPHDMDEPYSLNPLHYPKTVLSKSTIAIEIGLVLLVLIVANKKTRQKLSSVLSVRNLLMLVVFVAVFLVEMTIGAKKGDRYILPVFPFLIILGTIGIFYTVEFLSVFKISMLSRKVLFVVLTLSTSVFALIKLGPYELAYFNPLFPPNFSQELGWGEGFDQVATFLDKQPDRYQVASWYPAELRAYTKKTVLHINAHQQNNVGYVVLYRNMFGRSVDHWANDFIDEYYKKRTPIFVARVNGLEYAWVYKKPVVNSIVGEILPGYSVVIKEEMKADNLSAVSFAVATYSGKVQSGNMVLHIKESLDKPDLRTVSISASELQDGGLTKFKFEPIPETRGKNIYFIVTTSGVTVGNAPTLRVAKDEPNSTYSLIKNVQVTEKTIEQNRKMGWIGIDWFFIKDGKEISQLEVK